MRSLLAVLFAALLIACSSNPSSDPDAATGEDAQTGTDASGTDASASDAGADVVVPPSDGGGGFSILHSFDGDFGAGATGRGKPEMNVAANGSQVAQVTSQNFVVFDYTGKTLATTSMTALVTSAGLNPMGVNIKQPFEPHVVFDEFIQRWVISVTCLYDCVLVSDGPDATKATWKGFYLDNYGGDPSIHLAYDKNGVYFSEVVLANFNPDTPCCSTTVFAIPNGEMQWTTTLAPAHKNKTLGKPHETMLVNDHDPSKAPGAPTFFLARTCPSGNSCQGNSSTLITNQAFQWIVSYGTWSGTTFTITSNHTSVCAGGASPSDQCVRTDPNGTSDRWLYNTPIDPSQPGSSMKLRGAEIHRIIDAMQEGNHLHVVMGSGPCTSNCGVHGVDSADIAIWADLDCSTLASCKVGQTQKISIADHVLWPTIGVDPNGNVGIFANTVSATATHLGIEAWSHAASAAAGTLTGPTTVMAGTTAYTCSLATSNTAQTGNPVGVATVRDPLDPTALWVSEQYAASTADCHWQTRIVEYRP
jgi:hypothetical protein